MGRMGTDGPRELDRRGGGLNAMAGSQPRCAVTRLVGRSRHDPVPRPQRRRGAARQASPPHALLRLRTGRADGPGPLYRQTAVRQPAAPVRADPIHGLWALGQRRQRQVASASGGGVSRQRLRSTHSQAGDVRRRLARGDVPRPGLSSAPR